MLWFILAVLITIGLTVAAEVKKNDSAEVFLVSTLGLLTFAIIFNFGLSFLPDKVVTHTTPLVGPVTVEQVDYQYDFVYRTANGIHFNDSVNMLIDVGSPRVVVVTDYVAHNGWLSMFNWEPDHTTLRLPENETVSVVR